MHVCIYNIYMHDFHIYVSMYIMYIYIYIYITISNFLLHPLYHWHMPLSLRACRACQPELAQCYVVDVAMLVFVDIVVADVGVVCT